MTKGRKDSNGSSSRMLGFIWLLVSAGLAYPAYKMLMSMGFNQALAIVAVFIGACLLYEIPYRAKVKEQHEIAMKRANQWRG
ncbi:MAG: hypothetical protein C3F19_07795 [Rhodocyclales bacterium]|jgi:hypothetical protein|nr:hypothetical protein [Rhodocyclaceae bacterium]PWB40895.1 MAG: hypothetical protein C3F19_07795 [Rhodocyclales bacterium]GIK24172.1 MAG: hypothetical protein BroJett006_04180 [Betaproteobacteria bacterium]